VTAENSRRRALAIAEKPCLPVETAELLEASQRP
jgi:hypothetical protein